MMSRRSASFHVLRAARDRYHLPDDLFGVRGDVIFANHADAHRVASLLSVSAAAVAGMGLVHELAHLVVAHYTKSHWPGLWGDVAAALKHTHGAAYEPMLTAFVSAFPPPDVFRGERTAADVVREDPSWILEELLLLHLTNENPAYAPIRALVSDASLREHTPYLAFVDTMRKTIAAGTAAHAVPDDRVAAPANTLFARGESLLDVLEAPVRSAPGSIEGQLAYLRGHWAFALAGSAAERLLLTTAGFFREEERYFQRQHARFEPGTGDAPSFAFGGPAEALQAPPDVRRFTEDRHWMPRLVLLAKSVFVWLDQLSRREGRTLRTLADIPDAELETMASRGITGLWLIGLWERSHASRDIKERMGNPEAAASAYALREYAIAQELGGDAAYENLKGRAARYGIRLASDMVPNHMGIDSRWMEDHPDWFIHTHTPPFPSQSFDGPDLGTERMGIYLEAGYWTKSDASPVFKRVDKRTGETRYVYHGNDGTSTPWNDTAQLDLLRADVREALIETILHVARMFPVIRFDAAMTLAKVHVQRLWYPKPGDAGDVPSRAAFAIPQAELDRLMPHEFWRDVVDRAAVEAPDTLLLAEAFWMMEGYFVRTLGMHRVYNSAFMNMMMREDNAGYRRLVKEVLTYDPEILGRFVNFMNNPDEAPASKQFGRQDKYFGVCTLLATMPGLPMFGHGQFEGFEEKYGMEYRRAYWDEPVDQGLLEHHERAIVPLLRARARFAGSASFRLFDFVRDDGSVDEDVYAFANRHEGAPSLVVYRNRFGDGARGTLRISAPFRDGSGVRTESLAEALGARGGWYLLRDERGREILRTLHDGLTLQLGSYEAFAFTRIEALTDAEGAVPWHEVAAVVGLDAVPSLAAVRAELTVAPLRSALSQVLSPGPVAKLLGEPPKVVPAPGAKATDVATTKILEAPSVAPAPTDGPQVALRGWMAALAPFGAVAPADKALLRARAVRAGLSGVREISGRALSPVLGTEALSLADGYLAAWLLTRALGANPALASLLPAALGAFTDDPSLARLAAYHLLARPEVRGPVSLGWDPTLRSMLGVHRAGAHTYYHRESYETLRAFDAILSALESADAADVDAAMAVAVADMVLAERAEYKVPPTAAESVP